MNKEYNNFREDQQNKLIELRKELIESMSLLFGKSNEVMGRQVFEDYSNKKLAKILNCSNIGRHLQSPNLNDKNQPREDSFKRLIEKVNILNNYSQFTTNEDIIKSTLIEEKPNLILNKRRATIIAILLISASLLAFGQWLFTSKERRDFKTRPNTHLATPISPISPVGDTLTDHQAIILDPSFESREDGDYRNNWKNKYLGGLIQSTNTIVYDGNIAAKLPETGDRIGYQQISVKKHTDYILTFYYTLRSSPRGSLTVSILNDKIYDPNKIKKATVNSISLQDQSNEYAYKKGTLKFNSGDQTVMSIYFENEGVQCRLDAFHIKSI